MIGPVLVQAAPKASAAVMTRAAVTAIGHCTRTRFRRVRTATLPALLAVLAGCAGPLLPSAPAPPLDARLPASFSGSCHQVDEDGYGEDADLQVSGRQVRRLDWSLRVGRKGSCRFALADFRQVRTQPHLELVSRRDGGQCKLLIYAGPERVTLAHVDCGSQCRPAAISDESWPVMFDPASGRCARLGR